MEKPCVSPLTLPRTTPIWIETSRAYGDSASDVPTMNLTAHPVCVNPKKEASAKPCQTQKPSIGSEKEEIRMANMMDYLTWRGDLTLKASPVVPRGQPRHGQHEL